MTCPKYTASIWYEVHECGEQKAEAAFFYLSHFQCLFCYSVPKRLLESSRTVILSIVYSMSVHSTCKCAMLTGITVTIFTSKMKKNLWIQQQCNNRAQYMIWCFSDYKSSTPIRGTCIGLATMRSSATFPFLIFFIICWRKISRMNKLDCCSFSLLHCSDLLNLPKSII